MELVNMDPQVMHFVDTVLCADISTPVTGQLALDLMVNPPKPGDPSYDTYTQVTHLHSLKIIEESKQSKEYKQSSLCWSVFFSKEILLTQATLSQNAKRAQEFLNGLPGTSCQPAMGGMYLYPHLHLPSEIIEQAKVGNYYKTVEVAYTPDLWHALTILPKTLYSFFSFPIFHPNRFS